MFYYIILLKWLPSAIMLKSVSKVGDQKTFFWSVYYVHMSVMMSQHMTSWQLRQKWVPQHVTSWQLGQKSGPKNQDTNAIIIALILLSLNLIVKSGLHSQGYNNVAYCALFLQHQSDPCSSPTVKNSSVTLYWDADHIHGCRPRSAAVHQSATWQNYPQVSHIWQILYPLSLADFAWSLLCYTGSVCRVLSSI